MEILAKLLGSAARVKIMRLFILNAGTAFDVEDISTRSKVLKTNVRKELNTLSGMGFIKGKTLTKEGARGGKKRVSGWQLNPSFQYLQAVKELLIDKSLLKEDDLTSRFKQIGKIKLMVVSGVFIGDGNSRADLLIVGDKLKKPILNQIVKNLEAEIGKELDYVVLNTEEFKYRLDMYDKLVCDIIDLPHLKLIDSGQLSPQLSTYASKN